MENSEITDEVNDDGSSQSLTTKEKQKSKHQIKCGLCGVISCPMWRRLEDSNGLCCNVCHLKRVKTLVSQQQKLREKPKESTTVTRSGRKGRHSKYKNVGVRNNDKVSKILTARSRRAKLKKRPSKGGHGIATIVTSNRICYKEITYYIGDIVAATDFDGTNYYAQLRGFLQNDYGEKFGVITWLIPLVPNPKKFDPALFVPGPVEDIPRAMECFEFVCRAPNDFFKWRAPSISQTKTAPDLLSLVSVANELLTEVTSTEE